MVIANATLTELKTIRSNVDEYFHYIYIKAYHLAQKLIFQYNYHELHISRDNCSVNAPEEYFKITVFIPYLGLSINEVKPSFIEHLKILKGFQNLFPKSPEMSTLEKDEFICLIEFYKNNDIGVKTLAT